MYIYVYTHKMLIDEKQGRGEREKNMKFTQSYLFTLTRTQFRFEPHFLGMVYVLPL